MILIVDSHPLLASPSHRPAPPSDSRRTAGTADRPWRSVRPESVLQRSCTGVNGSPAVANGSSEPQVTTLLAHAAGMLQAGRSDCGHEGSGWLHRGSRRAATGVRNDRGARPKTVEDHDRRFRHRRPLT
jgi:hypothetical protein